MYPQFVTKLDQIGRTLVRWAAELKLTWGASAIAAWVFLLGLIDLWLRLDRSNRLATWSVLLVLVGGTAWLVRRALRQRFTPEAVAATVEKNFPQLDNHLINYLQLAKNVDGDPFKAAYVRAGVPEWQNLNFKRMRDEKALKRSRITLGVVAVLLLVPAIFFGQAWAVAVWRTVNPFSNVEPPSLTKILKVQPGQTTALQGEPLVLSAAVRGFEGHEVQVEVQPGDSQKATYSLGKIHGAEEQEFSYRIAKVTTALKYRFKAGDARPTNWFTVGTRPPPAFTSVTMVVNPPGYTKLAPRMVDSRVGRMILQAGSELRITAVSNTPLESISLRGAGLQSRFVEAGQPTLWHGTAIISSGTSIILKATDAFGGTVEEEVPFAIEADKAPGIEIVSPNGKALIPPGEKAQIEFQVADDFGVSEVVVEEIAPNATREDKGTELKRWKVAGDRDYHQIWKSENTPLHGADVAYRIVVRDNKPEHPNESVSATVVFGLPTQADMAKKRNDLEQAAVVNLQKVLDLQKRNLADTTQFQGALKTATGDQWKGAATRQTEIRGLMRDLLANPVKPLGTMTNAAQKIYANEMLLAIDSLSAIPAADDTRKPTLAVDAVALETKILKQLSFAMAAIGDAKIDRRVTGLAALLESLLKDQGAVLEQTKTLAQSKAKAGKSLVDSQDRVGGDMATFLASGKDEAAQATQTDVALADTLTKMVAKANELKIRSDMVIAAERLDGNQAAEALPLQEHAIAGLKSLQAMLEQVKLKEESEKNETMVEAVQQAKEKLAKLEALTQKMKEAMEQVKGQRNKDTEATDAMDEAFQEMQKNVKEALLEVPTDLHIFTELNVANDLVEDVFSVFQEIEQKMPGEKDGPTPKATELGYAKEDELLAQMGEASKRLDATEMWLMEKQDDLKVTTEAHDKAEMPESGIALAELAAAAQDLMSDLLKEEKNMTDEAQDSATNHAMPDFPSGGPVMEGDIASFGAQGKSGDQTPNHKEQDGRSNVGRQGMSTGETASGSGTIGEGDKNIEARRTEDPMQSGKIDLAGKADTKATGGGKLGTGKADAFGMGGGAERVDSKEAGSNDGMAALMARQADALFAKASMKNVRVDSLKDAAHQLRQSDDAIARGNIEQMKGFRKMAASSLSRATTQLQAGPSGAMEAHGKTGALDNVIESGPDQAPPQFRDKVAEYYKALNGAY